MSDTRPEGSDAISTVEVRVFRDGQLLTRELCESEEAAAAVVESWEETEGVHCVVEDLSAAAHHDSSLEMGSLNTSDEYPVAVEESDRP